MYTHVHPRPPMYTHVHPPKKDVHPPLFLVLLRSTHQKIDSYPSLVTPIDPHLPTLADLTPQSFQINAVIGWSSLKLM